MRFLDGYFTAWLNHHETLFGFYSTPKMRNLRFHKEWAIQKLYDYHANEILSMLGVKPHEKIARPGEVILCVEADSISTRHPGFRPSKHASFWRYFLRKVCIIDIH
jgi:hypothetical protein